MIVTGFLLLPIDAHSIEVLKSSKHVHSMRSNLRFSLKRWWWKCVQVCGDNFSTSPVISSPSPWWVQRSQVQQAEQVPSGANFIWCWLMIVGGYTALSVLEIMIMNHNSSTGHYPSTGNPWKSYEPSGSFFSFTEWPCSRLSCRHDSPSRHGRFLAEFCCTVLKSGVRICMLYHVVPCCTMLYHVVQCCTMLYRQ